jgi:hypothetical protein
MGNPQMSDRMRLGPTEALRAVFTGIGRLLMSADRPPRQPASQMAGQRGQDASAGSGAVRANGRRNRGQAAPVSSPWRSLDQTGNVRLLSAEDLDDGAVRPDPAQALDPEIVLAAEAAPAPETALDTEPAPAPETALGAETPGAADRPLAAEAPAAAELASPAEPARPEASAALPLASYDTLSLASIRARLRSLDPAQLRILAGYERTHAERTDVLGMLERRIEKLETGG